MNEAGVYLIVSDGRTDGEHWRLKATPPKGVALNMELLVSEQRVYIHGKTKYGSYTATAWAIVNAKDNGDGSANLVLRDQNPELNTDKALYPIAGILYLVEPVK
jgi:hypothetical protein